MKSAAQRRQERDAVSYAKWNAQRVAKNAANAAEHAGRRAAEGTRDARLGMSAPDNIDTRTDPYAVAFRTEVARMRKSVGHIEFSADGSQEFYEQDGHVYRAHVGNAFDVEGRRHGRWEGRVAWFAKNRVRLVA